MRIFSIGYSCFSKLSIKDLTLDHRSFPFDYLITTKPFIIEFFKSIYYSKPISNYFNILSDNTSWSKYTMPAEKTSGILLGSKSEGLYIWHSLSQEQINDLKTPWENKIPELREKYSFLFDRFTQTIIDSSCSDKSYFIISNCQFNLVDFGNPGEWDFSFGFDTEFVCLIREEIKRIINGPFQIIIITHSLEEFINISNSCPDYILEDIFLICAGKTDIKACNSIKSLIIDSLQDISYHEGSNDISGLYENNIRIESLTSNLNSKNNLHYLIFDRDEKLRGLITKSISGYYVIIDNKHRYSAIYTNNTLYLSDKQTKWRKITLR